MGLIDWVGLDWIGLDWIGLDWIGLDWVGLGWIGWRTISAVAGAARTKRRSMRMMAGLEPKDRHGTER